MAPSSEENILSYSNPIHSVSLDCPLLFKKIDIRTKQIIIEVLNLIKKFILVFIQELYYFQFLKYIYYKKFELLNPYL